MKFPRPHLRLALTACRCIGVMLTPQNTSTLFVVLHFLREQLRGTLPVKRLISEQLPELVPSVGLPDVITSRENSGKPFSRNLSHYGYDTMDRVKLVRGNGIEPLTSNLTLTL